MITVINKSIKKEEFDKKLSEFNNSKKLDSYRFCGIIQLVEDPLSIQKKMRDEWK